ncbi:MAG: phospholipid carrier-dependent glycosyltransferase [Endozoicomonas sp. (ex Botrylloides leachii)]|nr:phospholipid carrier-dependent glycosyltransferase [Endozoicomonas sp. (ex Botrylloides leachii)]
MNEKSRVASNLWIITCVICITAFLIRLLGIGLYPLQDTSEARYAEMARIMAETNDWITLWFDYNVPFWGKPPLFIWLSALSFKVFGVNEFAARLPSILVSLGVIWFTYKLALFQMGRIAGHLVLLILPTTGIFLALSGAILAGPVMLLSIIMIQTGFWIGWHSDDPKQADRWQYLFFIGCAIALLAKGLAALVLAGLPIFFWCLPKKRLVKFWKKFPCIKGTLVTLLISAPWYIANEIQNPGFLHYFFIGEHFMRYLDSGWEGDRYGAAHAEAIGTIWPLWLGTSFPWSIAIVFLAGKWCVKRYKGRGLPLSDWQFFMLLLFSCPLLFFTFAKNIIWTYALPAAPAMALLLADRWKNSWQQHVKWMTGTALLTPLLISVITIFLANDKGKSSHKYFIELVKQQGLDDPQLLFLYGASFSSRFYSRGKIVSVNTIEALGEVLKDTTRRHALIVSDNDFSSLPDELQQQFEPIGYYKKDTLYLNKVSGLTNR